MNFARATELYRRRECGRFSRARRNETRLDTDHRHHHRPRYSRIGGRSCRGDHDDHGIVASVLALMLLLAFSWALLRSDRLSWQWRKECRHRQRQERWKGGCGGGGRSGEMGGGCDLSI